MLPRVVQSRVRACFECVERILVVLVDRDLDAVEGDEGTRSHVSSRYTDVGTIPRQILCASLLLDM